jgi:hypothetical protein
MLTIVIGVSVPFSSGPTGFFAEGLFRNGETFRVNGNSLVNDKASLVLIAAMKALQKARDLDGSFREVELMAFEKDIQGVQLSAETSVFAKETRYTKAFEREFDGLSPKWSLFKEPRPEQSVAG